MAAADIQTIAAVAVPGIGFIVWLVRLEGRINTNDAMQRKTAEDVEYIRARIDRALNGRHD